MRRSETNSFPWVLPAVTPVGFIHIGGIKTEVFNELLSVEDPEEVLTIEAPACIDFLKRDGGVLKLNYPPVWQAHVGDAYFIAFFNPNLHAVLWEPSLPLNMPQRLALAERVASLM